MLVLTRKKGQSIILGDEIEFTILDVIGDQIKIGINAPKDIAIYRKEVYTEIKEENTQAAQANIMNFSELLKNIKNK